MFVKHMPHGFDGLDPDRTLGHNLDMWRHFEWHQSEQSNQEKRKQESKSSSEAEQSTE